MQQFEYRIIPAPKRAVKVRGVKTPEDRFAHTLTEVVNELAREGWEYLRADTLPAEERVGFTGKTTVFQHMLVFRRGLLAAHSERLPVAKADMSVLFGDQPSSDIDIDPSTIAAIRAVRADAPATNARLVAVPESGDAPSVGPAGTKNTGHAAE